VSFADATARIQLVVGREDLFDLAALLGLLVRQTGPARGWGEGSRPHLVVQQLDGDPAFLPPAGAASFVSCRGQAVSTGISLLGTIGFILFSFKIPRGVAGRAFCPAGHR
jgi:hypothetical protein